MRITKIMAEEMAKHLVSNSESAIRLKGEIKQFIENLESDYMKHLPQIIKDCFEKYPNYVETSAGFTIHNGENLHKEISKHLLDFAGLRNKIFPRNKRYYGVGFVLGSDYKIVYDKYSELIDEVSRIKDIESQLQGLIYSLSTIPRIIKEYPELSSFVEKYNVKKEQALSTNYRSLIEKLK